MCYNSPGPRCAGHTRTLFRQTKEALIVANTNYVVARNALAEADDVQAQAALMDSEKLLKLAQANHADATEKYDASKADRAEKMEAFRKAKDDYCESAEGIQALRDAGKVDEAERYACVREMKLEELKRVEAAKADIANGAIKAVMEKPVVKQEVPDLTGKSFDELESMSEQDDITPETLQAMASMKMEYEWYENDLKQLVARHEVTSPKTLDDLSHEYATYVRQNVAGNLNTLPKTLVRLAEDGEASVRSFVADNPSANADMLRRLANDHNYQVRATAARNPNTPDEVLSELARDDDDSVAGASLDNENATHQMMRDAVSKHGHKYWVNRTLGARHDLPSDVLSTLANNNHQAALRNPALSVDTMKTIVQGDRGGLYDVAANPSLPVELMEEVKKNKTNPRWRQALALNPSAPGHMLASLYNAETKDCLAINPATPVEVYDKMAKDQDYNFRVRLAKSATVPLSTLQAMLAKDKSKQVREAAAANPRFVQA